MNQIIINGGNNRYLSELKEFRDGIPAGVVNKSKTDVGGTYCAINCKSNYIVVCPFKDLVDSICADINNQYEVFKCYGGVTELEFTNYLNRNSIYKVAVTYDSLPKLLGWMNYKTEGWKILVDEYQLILEDMDYRFNAINGLMESIKLFNHYSFLSATPIDFDFEIDFLKQLPHYKVNWDNLTVVNPIRYKVTNINKGSARFIQIFLTEGFTVPDINGNNSNVEELYIFINSVKSIKQILDSLELDAEDVKICCADRNRNRLQLGNYTISPVCSPNKRINFFTKKCFQGCNLFTNNGLVVVASDCYKVHTLVDISTAMEQIAGRIRTNNIYQNIFRNVLIHFYNVNGNMQTDEEFNAIMKAKDEEAETLLKLQDKAPAEELKTILDRINIDNDVVSIIDGKLVYNELKKQSFIYKFELRKVYRSGITIAAQYNKSEKFTTLEQEDWSDFNIKMAKATTVSYQQLLKDYIENPSESYELEYPEFRDIVKYLKESEINSLRWNKDKLMKAVDDKKKLNKVFKAIHQTGFISSKELKIKIADAFKQYGISLTPKASIIEQCYLYPVSKVSRKVDGSTVKGYELGNFSFCIDYYV